MKHSNIDRLTAAVADRYRVERELGAGGMATVYLARDLKHDRDVAIKVLHPDLGAALGGERFLSEIRTTARLQHPHILPLLDSGEADGLLFYVMPLVTGETLRARLERERQLPIADAVRIAREIASALDYAHRQSVIHRDIKPENILLHDGQAIVADFGIALAVQSAGGQRMTQTGLSLGTPQYMSPEQAMGERTIDARSDIYALGAVTYEMLAGDAPFTGGSVQAIVAKVLNERPTPLQTLRDTVPPHVAQAVFTALAKLPADRFASAAAFAEALDVRASGGAESAKASGPSLRWKQVAFATTTLAAVAVLAAGWTLIQRPVAEERRAMRAVIELPDSLELAAFDGGRVALSPDGTQLALVARPSVAPDSAPMTSALWIRSMDRLEATRLALGDLAAPRFSRDSRQIVGVDARGVLQVVTLSDGSVRTRGSIGARRNNIGDAVAFAPDGSLITTGLRDVLVRFPAGGGPPGEISVIDSAGDGNVHTQPDVLPNGKGVVFSIVRVPAVNAEMRDIAVRDLESGKQSILGKGVLARYVAGYLLIVRANGALVAVPFDANAQRVTGAEVQIATDVHVGQFGRTDFAVSDDGSLVYTKRTATSSNASLVWVSRDGSVAPVDARWNADFESASISPDGQRLAVSINEDANANVWIREPDGAKAKLTFGVGRRVLPRWFDGGKRLHFISQATRPFGVFAKRADGIGEIEPLASLSQDIADAFVSGNGQWLLMRTYNNNAQGRGDILGRRLGDSATVPLVANNEIQERHPALSPDDKRIAYTSNLNGRAEVYVRPFPNVNDGMWMVSLDGGSEPVWARSGRELFYVSSTGEMWSATVGTEPAFTVRERRKLFTLPAGIRANVFAQRFDIAPGDQRFLMIRENAETTRGAARAKVVLTTNVLGQIKALERASK